VLFGRGGSAGDSPSDESFDDSLAQRLHDDLDALSFSVPGVPRMLMHLAASSVPA